MILVLTANIVVAATVLTAVIGLLAWSIQTSSSTASGFAGHVPGERHVAVQRQL